MANRNWLERLLPNEWHTNFLAKDLLPLRLSQPGVKVLPEVPRPLGPAPADLLQVWGHWHHLTVSVRVLP